MKLHNNDHTIQSGLNQLNIKSSGAIVDKIVAYIELLRKWNRIHNLTAISDPKAILVRHIFDSLSIVPFVKCPDILDFGTGAGLPGIPLALVLPECDFVLLDSSNKKTTFLNHVVLSLGIKNTTIINKRVEEFHFERLFATIVTRATTKIEEVINKTSHLCAKNGQIIIMKGKNPEEELKFIKQRVELHRIYVPYLNEERHVVKVLI